MKTSNRAQLCPGVLLTNLGSPEAPSPAAVRPYLRDFLGDRRVVEAPRLLWWLVLNLVILPFRPRRSARLYARIWTDEGSPLLAHSRRQAEAVGKALSESASPPPPVALGMRYGRPSIAEGLNTLSDAGCNRILALPLYPQYSATTVATTFDAIARELSSWREVPALRTVHDYHQHPAYIRALARTVQESWQARGRADHLLVSFHGLPQRYADAGDPYPQHCSVTARLLARELNLSDERWSMAFQSRLGREPWLSPYTVETTRRLAHTGSSLEVICPGFACDCLETLDEIDRELREVFEEAGGRDFRYIPALNDHPAHIKALDELVVDNLKGWWP